MRRNFTKEDWKEDNVNSFVIYVKNLNNNFNAKNPRIIVEKINDDGSYSPAIIQINTLTNGDVILSTNVTFEGRFIID